MAKDDLVYIGHMLDMAEKALQLQTGVGESGFTTRRSERQFLG